MPEIKAIRPFHMSHIDENVPILPEGAHVKGARFVDIGTIQTDPNISEQADLGCNSCFDLTLV
jgi:hypothetical protein